MSTSVPSSARSIMLPSPESGSSCQLLRASHVKRGYVRVDRAAASSFDQEWRIATERRRMAGMLEGKVAVVTGAGGGIGREIAIAMAQAGARVIINDVGASLSGEGRSATPAEETKRLNERG